MILVKEFIAGVERQRSYLRQFHHRLFVRRNHLFRFVIPEALDALDIVTDCVECLCIVVLA